MKPRKICIHNLDQSIGECLADFKVVATSRDFGELQSALTAVNPEVLVIDLDDADALNIVARATEIRPDLSVVGVTGQNDPRFVITAVRGGCKQITTKPIDLNDLTVAIRRAVNDSVENHQSGKTIGVISSVGGIGGTTVACHLGVGIADSTGASVLVADLDLDFGGVARAWDVRPEHSIADVASAGAVDVMLLKKATVEMSGGVAILARPETIGHGHAIDETLMGDMIRTARNAFSHVVLDIPRRLDVVTGAAIDLCDHLLIVVQPTVPSVDNARRLNTALQAQGMAREKIEVVVNRYRKNTYKVTLETIEKTLERKPIVIIPNDYKAVSAALDLGQPMDSRNAVRTAIRQLALHLTGRASAQAPRAGSGWFSKFKLVGRA